MNDFPRYVFQIMLSLFLLPNALSASFFINLKNYYTRVPPTRVAIISLKGSIVNSGSIGYQLKESLEDETIKALVLQIDSGGGAAGASQALFYEIVERNKIHQKPIVVWVENICASGAYYIASAATWIVATPSAVIGSIGAYCSWFQGKEFIEQLKLHHPIIASGKFKTTTHQFSELTSEQREHMHEHVTDIRKQFETDVATQRQLSGDLWKEGRVFTGRQALELGLIDEVGSQITVERAIRRLANITGAIEWIRPNTEKGWLKLFGEKNDEDKHPYIKAFVHEVCTKMGIDMQQSPLKY